MGSMEENALVIGTVVSLISVSSLIWGLLGINFVRIGVYIVYTIVLGFIGLIFVGFILLAKTNLLNQKRINRYVCGIMLLSIISFILLLVDSIIIIVDYAELEKSLGEGQQIPSHEWAAVFVPSIISLLCLVAIGFCSFINFQFI